MAKSSKDECEQGGIKYVALNQELKKLEKEWESFEKSRPRKQRLTYSSTRSQDITSIITSVGNSPRELMSSLQQRKSPSPPRLKSRDIAVEEILSDRRAAIISGQLKGRRLSFDAGMDFKYGHGGEICSGCLNDIQEKQVTIDENFNSFSEKKMVTEVAEKRGGGGSMVAIMAFWFGVALIVLTLGLLFMTCNGKHVLVEHESILVPT